MAVFWKCDVCGKDTVVNPQTEQVEEERVVEVTVSGQKVKASQRVPVTTTTRRQDPVTGRVAKITVPKLNDLQPRTVIVQVKAGPENFQRDLCRECYETSTLKQKVEAVIEELSAMTSR